MKDGLVSRTRREHLVRPVHYSYSTEVAFHGSDKLSFVYIPNLENTEVGSYGQVSAVGRPLYTSHRICRTEVVKLRHFLTGGVPEVDAGAQTHSQEVASAPVDEVEIEVVLQGGSV